MTEPELTEEEKCIFSLETQLISFDSIKKIFVYIYQQNKLYPGKPILQKDLYDNLMDLNYHNIWHRMKIFTKCKFLKRIPGYRVAFVMINQEQWEYIYKKRIESSP